MSRPAQIDPVERQLVLILKRERLRRNLSATALAKSVGVSRTTVTHMESDDARPTLWVLLKIAKGLDLDFAQCVVEALKARR